MPDAIVEPDGHVLTITLNRPERMNALSGAMLVRMYDAFIEASASDEIRCIILTGAGGNFSSGADLKAMAGDAGGSDPEIDVAARLAADPDLHWKALLRTYRPPKPIIAAVEGVAIAGGTEILQATEIRIAGESARFGVSEVRWSLYPMGGSAVRLRRQIPYTHAFPPGTIQREAPLQHGSRGVEARFRNLDSLRRQGVIGQAEYRERRQDILTGAFE
jgi:enoyl-CoA hydratase/carnithine racemase